MINIPLEIGDIILTGRFKNIRVQIKEIGVDDYGNPTVNGRSILKIRIPKLYVKENNMKSINEMALKVKIKKDKGKYNIHACTVDGIDETPLNYTPYETEQHALASAIYKGYDVDDELEKPKKATPIKNQEVPRVKHDKPKEMDLGKEREIKLENLVRRIYNELTINEQYTENDLKFVDGKCVIKKGRKTIAQIYYRPEFYKINNITSGYSFPYALNMLGGIRECKDLNEVLLYLNKYSPKTESTISELDITDPTLVAELETMADLAERMDKMKAELSALTAQFQPLDEKFTAMLDAIDENKERVLRTKNVLVTIKKKGYEAESIKYKELFEALYGKINGKLKKIANDMKTAATTIKKVSSSIATQKLNSESKLNEGMLSNLWNKVKNYITSFTSKIKQQGQSVDADLEKLEKLSLK